MNSYKLHLKVLLGFLQYIDTKKEVELCQVHFKSRPSNFAIDNIQQIADAVQKGL